MFERNNLSSCVIFIPSMPTQQVLKWRRRMGATRTHIVDLERLQRAGNDGILAIRLMMSMNDISLAVKRASEFKKEQPGISKHAQQANRRYFIQLQCGHLHEALKLVEEVTQSSAMRSLISNCPKVTQEAYRELLDYPYNVTWLMASHILLCLMLWLPTAYARPGVRSCRGTPHSAPSVPCDPSPSPCCRQGPGNGQEQQHGEVF
jgi:hypothetical protein